MDDLFYYLPEKSLPNNVNGSVALSTTYSTVQQKKRNKVLFEMSSPIGLVGVNVPFKTGEICSSENHIAADLGSTCIPNPS